MNAPTLVVLAAGLGSRYGGIKQMDPVGPSGEFVLDYSIYDAWRAGFRQVVLVIRPELGQPLREHFGDHLDGRLDVSYVCQDLGDLPEGFSLPADRRKPWGTGHAVWSARKAVFTPFGVINADDFYGSRAYASLAGFLSSERCNSETFCMVAYQLANTLSDYGTVSRGICRADADGFLLSVTERTAIEKTGDAARFRDDSGQWQTLSGDELASLNLWGFAPEVFPNLEQLFAEFLRARGDDPKAEFFIPTVVDTLITRGIARTAVLETDERWFGMTYREDRERVIANVAQLIRDGVYPAPLWS